MDWKNKMIEKEITCHFCFEQFEVSLEIGSSFIGKNIEIYDCEICCNPNKLEYVVDNGEIIINNVSDGNEWKNYTSHHLIEGLCAPSELNTGKLRRSLYFRTFEGGINGKGESESPPKEEVFDEEKEMLEKVYETKSGLLEGRWIVQNKQSISQPSFISTNVVDGEVSVEFEWLIWIGD